MNEEGMQLFNKSAWSVACCFRRLTGDPHGRPVWYHTDVETNWNGAECADRPVENTGT